MTLQRTIAYVIAGGKGERLYPLTRDRGKPAVHFMGTHRLIDFVLSNLVNSNIRDIYVLTQYEPKSLRRHIQEGWYPLVGSREMYMIQASQGNMGGWYEGTADAIAKNIGFIRDKRASIVNLFAADHIYQMDVSQMNDEFIDKQADLMISAVPVKKELAAGNFGVLEVDNNGKLVGYAEKPVNPLTMPGNPEYSLASMGNFTFKSDVLLEELAKDSKKHTASKDVVRDNPANFSTRDLAYDVIPEMLRSGREIYAYNFQKNKVIGTSKTGYWRDVGNLDQFFETNMEFAQKNPPIDLYNKEWLIHTLPESLQAPLISHSNISNSRIANGSIIGEADISNSIIGYNTIIEDGAKITDSVLLGNGYVGKKTIIRRAIIDRYVNIPDGETVGIDVEKSKERNFTISGGGITVVPRNYEFTSQPKS